MSVRARESRGSSADRASGAVRTPRRARVGGPSPRDAVRGPGLPLEPSLRHTMERRFGHDFGDVRVHADEAAAASARVLAAAAYSTGRHIVFGEGEYAPREARGQRLLAHELAHVAQRNTAGPGGETQANEAALEADARQAADAAAGGRAAAVQHTAPGASVLRQAASAAEAPRSRPPREERFNVGRGGGRADAELDRSVGWLTARMKVRFVKSDAPTPWPSAARFTQFQNDFIQAVTARWSFKHYLVPARECPGEPQLVAVRLQVVPVTSGQHFTVTVGYTTTFRTSSVGGRTGTFDVLDVARRGDVPQTPAEHEFGHMLGLGHITCERNDDECYGTTREERADILGSGSFVSPRDYEPFAELMSYFTGCNYRVQQASQIPTSRAPDIGGAIGGVVGGLGLGAVGMAIGAAAFGPIGAAVGGLIGLVGGAIGGFFAGRAIATPRIPS